MNRVMRVPVRVPAVRARFRPQPGVFRMLHLTPRLLLVNPLLPFDVLEELENEEVKDKNEKLQKQKKALLHQKKVMKEKLSEEENKHKLEQVVEFEQLDVRNVNSSAGGSGGLPPNNNDKQKESDADKKEEKKNDEDFDEDFEEPSKLRETLASLGRFFFKCLETIGITLSSVGVLGLSGFLYHKFYSRHVLDKMDEAFQKGDPAYQLAIHKKTNKLSEDGAEALSQYWVTRPQQKLLDDIVSGKIRGRYFLVVGEKGTGKTTLIMDAMKKIDGNNVAIFDAHADPEIFRIRLGRALNFAYNEDYIGSLFSIRGPRDTTALLDIERAFNKLEELAIKRRIQGNSDKPLVLIINNLHLIKENEEGIKLLELLQQKAESLSSSELATIVFNSDDYWVYEKLKRLGTRLELIHVRDLNRKETVDVLKFIRGKSYPQKPLSDDLCHQIYSLIGGRPQHISQVARHSDVIKACHEIIDREKTWFLNQCGLLGEEMDDDVMEFGKFSLSAMLLMREFVEMDRRRLALLLDLSFDHVLPELPLWRLRQIMTRPDYIQLYDNLNIFTVDLDSRVRADSVPMMRAFHEIASQANFDSLLAETVDRVAAIESLGRTRELVMKDLAEGAKYTITDNEISVRKPNTEGGSDGNHYMEELSKAAQKKRWWQRRMGRFDESYLPREAGAGDTLDSGT